MSFTSPQRNAPLPGGQVATGAATGAALQAAFERLRAGRIQEAQAILGRKLTSHSVVAGPVVWAPAAT